MKYTVFSLLMCCIALCSCEKHTVTYTYPEGPQAPEDAATLLISSKNKIYVSEDEHTGSATFRSRGGELVLNVSTNQESWAYETDEATWLTFEKNALDELHIIAEANTEREARRAVITLRAGGEKDALAATATVSIAQNAFGSLEIGSVPDTALLPARGNTIAEFVIDCGTDEWSFDCPCAWLLVEKQDNDKLLITAEENAAFEERSITITLTAGSGEHTVSSTIDVAQQPAANIAVDPPALSFMNTGGQNQVTVVSNYEWSYNCTADWLTITREGDLLQVKASDYDELVNREAAIVITAGDGKENLTTYPIAVTQLGHDPTAMVFVLNVATDGAKAYLPLAGNINCTVYWGDTNVEEITTVNPSHTYEFAGEYIVTVKGKVTALTFPSSTSPITAAIRKYITEVRQWGTTGLTSLNNAFYNCAALRRIPADTDNSFAQVTTFSGAFRNCDLESIPAGLFVSASQAMNFDYTFSANKSIQEIPAGLFDNCRLATSFASTFYQAAGITAIPAGLFDNCPEVISFNSVFSSTSLVTLPANLFKNQTKLVTASSLFSNTKLTAIPAGLLDNCPEITTLNGAFRGLEITSIPEGLFQKTTKCTNMGYIFALCPKLETIPAHLFDPLVECSRFDYAFQGCSVLKRIPNALFANFTKCSTYGSAFADCSALETIPADLFAHASNGTGSVSFLKTFNNCVALTDIPAELFATADATTFEKTFQNCTALKNVPSGLFADKNRVTTFANVFDGCTQLAAVPADLFSGCTGVKTATYMFQGCKALESVPEGLFDAFEQVTTYAYTFQNCTALKSIPVSLFDASKGITAVNFLFAGCSGLTGESPYTLVEGVKIHLYERTTTNGFTKAITSRTKCFNGCTGLTDYEAIPTAWK